MASPDELVLRWAPIPDTDQEGFFDDDTPEADLLFQGGYAAGKTMTLTAKMLKLSAINAPLPILWVVPRWRHIKNTILPALEDLDPETGEPWFLRLDQFHYQPSDHILNWDGGGPIWFVSADDPDSIKGPNMAAAGMDEPGGVKHAAWRNTVARVRHPRAVLRQRVASGTPEGLGWLMDTFGDPTERPDTVHVYEMATAENLELLKWHPDYEEQVRANSTEAEIASYLGGKFVNLTGGLAYPTFDASLHWREDVALDEALPLRVTFDFNVDPMACIIGQQSPGPHGMEYRAMDALILSSSTIMEVCDVFAERYPQWKAGLVIYGDATGRARSTVSRQTNYDIIKQMLSGIGPLTMKVARENPPVRRRLNSVNRLLKDARGAVRFVIRKMQPHRVCPLRGLVKSLQQTLIKPGTSELWKKSGETITHAADALGYWLDVEAPAMIPHVMAVTMKAATGPPVSNALMALRARKAAARQRDVEAAGV